MSRFSRTLVGTFYRMTTRMGKTGDEMKDSGVLRKTLVPVMEMMVGEKMAVQALDVLKSKDEFSLVVRVLTGRATDDELRGLAKDVGMEVRESQRRSSKVTKTSPGTKKEGKKGKFNAKRNVYGEFGQTRPYELEGLRQCILKSKGTWDWDGMAVEFREYVGSLHENTRSLERDAFDLEAIWERIVRGEEPEGEPKGEVEARAHLEWHVENMKRRLSRPWNRYFVPTGTTPFEDLWNDGVGERVKAECARISTRPGSEVKYVWTEDVEKEFLKQLVLANHDRISTWLRVRKGMGDGWETGQAHVWLGNKWSEIIDNFRLTTPGGTEYNGDELKRKLEAALGEEVSKEKVSQMVRRGGGCNLCFAE